MNTPSRIEIVRTEVNGVIRYRVGAHAIMKVLGGGWGMFPYADASERPMWITDTLEACLDMAAGAVALMQPL